MGDGCFADVTVDKGKEWKERKEKKEKILKNREAKESPR